MENTYNLFLNENESNVTAFDDLLKSPIRYPWEEAGGSGDGEIERSEFEKFRFPDLNEFLGTVDQSNAMEQDLSGKENHNELSVANYTISSNHHESNSPTSENCPPSTSFKTSEGSHEPFGFPTEDSDQKMEDVSLWNVTPENITTNDEETPLPEVTSPVHTSVIPNYSQNDGEMDDATILSHVQAVLSDTKAMVPNSSGMGVSGWGSSPSYPSEGHFSRNGQRKEIQKPPTTAGITLDDLKAVFHMERPKAEKRLCLKRTTFSNLSRYYGISKWPFRTIRDALNRIKANEKLLVSGEISKDKHRKITEQQRRLQGVIRLIYLDPTESRDSNTLAVLLRIVAEREDLSRYCEQ